MSEEQVEFSHFIISLAQSVKEGFSENAQESSQAMARYSLGTLRMLQSKTKGNLNEAEEKLMEALLNEFQKKEQQEASNE